MKKVFLILSVFSLTFTACKKEGCTDSTATNYDSKADDDDGSCTYATDTTNTSGGGGTTVDTTGNTSGVGGTTVDTTGTTNGGGGTPVDTTTTVTTGVTLTADGAEIQLETIGRSYKTQPTLNGIPLPQTYGSEKDDSNGGGACGGCDQYTKISALRCMNLDSTSEHQSAAIEFNFPFQPATGSYKVIYGSSADKAHPAPGTVYVIATGYKGNSGTTYKGKSGTVDLKVTGKVYELSFNKIGTADKSEVDNDVLSGQLRFTFP